MGIGWVSEDDFMPLPPGASWRQRARWERERALWLLRGRPFRRLRAEVVYAQTVRHCLTGPLLDRWFGFQVRAGERIAGRRMPMRKRIAPKPRLVPRRVWLHVDWLVWAVRERRKAVR